jgi:hypothetical protein
MSGDLLDAADDLLRRPSAGGTRPRAAVLLLRLAREMEVDAFWVRSGLAEVADSPMRAQLPCLSHYAGYESAGQARTLWGQLSEACHYHCYELAPTAAELRRSTSPPCTPRPPPPLT